VRAEPGDDAEQVTQVLSGEPLAVEEKSGEWDRIRTAYELSGLDPRGRSRRQAGRRVARPPARPRRGRRGARVARHPVPVGRANRGRNRLLRPRAHRLSPTRPRRSPRRPPAGGGGRAARRGRRETGRPRLPRPARPCRARRVLARGGPDPPRDRARRRLRRGRGAARAGAPRTTGPLRASLEFPNQTLARTSSLCEDCPRQLRGSRHGRCDE
jgi:hypothetical protein